MHLAIIKEMAQNAKSMQSHIESLPARTFIYIIAFMTLCTHLIMVYALHMSPAVVCWHVGSMPYIRRPSTRRHTFLRSMITLLLRICWIRPSHRAATRATSKCIFSKCVITLMSQDTKWVNHLSKHVYANVARRGPIYHRLKKSHLWVNTQILRHISCSAFGHTAANSTSPTSSSRAWTAGASDSSKPACPESDAPISPMHSSTQDSFCNPWGNRLNRINRGSNWTSNT